ncbi:hypothetical protein OF83DRAFT_1172408 [Amylostereum chailletii]|nr:hypothetical protein OF83DRAFT_1172408 [Amylostereum chailletii]
MHRFTSFPESLVCSSLLFGMIYTDTSELSWCQALSVFFLTFGSLSIALASFIVVLRVIAIWNRNVVVSVFSIAMRLKSAALNLQGPLSALTSSSAIGKLTRTFSAVPFLTRSYGDDSTKACYIVSDGSFNVNVPVTLTSDLVLLSLMLVGLIRKPEAHAQGIFCFLYCQGVMWLSLAFVVEVSALVLVRLNLNGV